MSVKYHVYYLAPNYCSRVHDDNGEVPAFDTPEEAVRFAKAYCADTNDAFAIQIIGFKDDVIPVYSKTIVAKDIGNYTYRGRVL